ncbi:MAG: hypothetical protein KC619_03535 [Myxococcales bacterium]|nr:hypothetical protein [Myxococcales bacterium]
MAPYRDGTVHRSPVVHIRWEGVDPDAPRILVIEHDPGDEGLPEQRRLPEGFGLEALGGLLGFLGLGALLLHRLARSPKRLVSHLRFGPDRLSVECGDDARAWTTSGVVGFGTGEDTPEWRTVFVTHAEGRELLLQGLPPDDARRAAEALDEARRLFSAPTTSA